MNHLPRSPVQVANQRVAVLFVFLCVLAIGTIVTFLTAEKTHHELSDNKRVENDSLNSMETRMHSLETKMDTLIASYIDDVNFLPKRLKVLRNGHRQKVIAGTQVNIHYLYNPIDPTLILGVTVAHMDNNGQVPTDLTPCANLDLSLVAECPPPGKHYLHFQVRQEGQQASLKRPAGLKRLGTLRTP